MNRRSVALGLRCWPQWSDWLICYQTGALVDPYGQRYTPATIQAGAFLMALNELRDRAIFADVGQPAPVLESADLVLPRLTRRDVAEAQRRLVSGTPA